MHASRRTAADTGHPFGAPAAPAGPAMILTGHRTTKTLGKKKVDLDFKNNPSTCARLSALRLLLMTHTFFNDTLTHCLIDTFILNAPMLRPRRQMSPLAAWASFLGHSEMTPLARDGGAWLRYSWPLFDFVSAPSLLPVRPARLWLGCGKWWGKSDEKRKTKKTIGKKRTTKRLINSIWMYPMYEYFLIWI